MEIRQNGNRPVVTGYFSSVKINHVVITNNNMVGRVICGINRSQARIILIPLPRIAFGACGMHPRLSTLFKWVCGECRTFKLNCMSLSLLLYSVWSLPPDIISDTMCHNMIQYVRKKRKVSSNGNIFSYNYLLLNRTRFVATFLDWIKAWRFLHTCLNLTCMCWSMLTSSVKRFAGNFWFLFVFIIFPAVSIFLGFLFRYLFLSMTRSSILCYLLTMRF